MAIGGLSASAGDRLGVAARLTGKICGKRVD
jgi:hypothetical protein